MAGIYLGKVKTNILRLSKNNNVFYVPEVIGGRYDVKVILAYGGVGDIFEAKDWKLFGKDVLIKAPYVKEEFFKERNKATEKYIGECKNNIELEATINNLGIATPKWKSWVMTATEKDRNSRSSIYKAIDNVHGINR